MYELEIVELGAVSAETRGVNPTQYLEDNGAAGCQLKRPIPVHDPDC